MSEISEFLNQGQRCINLGNPKDALVHFENALRLEPKNIEANLKKGNILGKIGKYDLAIKSYDTALSIEPENVLALLNKGLALHYLQEYQNAIVCYDMVLKLKPENPIALYNKASSLAKQNKIDEGIEILKNLIKKDFSFKEKAKSDIDFQHIKHLNEFKKITL